jgi:hypothetical protein
MKTRRQLVPLGKSLDAENHMRGVKPVGGTTQQKRYRDFRIFTERAGGRGWTRVGQTVISPCPALALTAHCLSTASAPKKTGARCRAEIFGSSYGDAHLRVSARSNAASAVG